jgi:hypothetical protein
VNVDALRVPGPAKYDLVGVDQKMRRKIAFTMRPKTVDFIGMKEGLCCREEDYFEGGARTSSILLHRSLPKRRKMLFLKIQQFKIRQNRPFLTLPTLKIVPRPTKLQPSRLILPFGRIPALRAPRPGHTSIHPLIPPWFHRHHKQEFYM